MTVIDTFADFAATIEPPASAISSARRCILDWYGGAIAGSVEMPATGLRQVLPEGGPSRLLPDGAPTDARTAALINGTASHTVEVDDIYRSGLYHPGVVTIPAALATAEAIGASGRAMLNGVIAGYEIGNRIAEAVNPSHYQHWHTTATVGHFGAAAAAAVVLGLPAPQIAHALANAATFAAGLRHAFSADGMSKPLHAGRAAEAGVFAALSSKAGVTGVGDMLEGERGFGAAMSLDVDWHAATASLGTDWTINRITQKAHACCGHNFAAIDAVRILMTEQDIGVDDIAGIRVGTYRAAVEICGNPDPQSAAEARFSLPWCAAAIAENGAVTPAAFTDAALGQASTRALAARVDLQTDRDAEARFPHARSAIVTLTTQDGASHTHRRPTRKGDPDDPMTDDEIAAKFKSLAVPVIGGISADALGANISRMDQIADIRKELGYFSSTGDRVTQA